MYILFLVLLIQAKATVASDPPAVAANEKIAKQCTIFPMTHDCNWDPIFLKIAPKPTKDTAFFCSYEGTGNLTMFFTGNDFALTQLAGIKKALSTVYKKLYFAARPVCLVFEDFTKDYAAFWGCKEVYNKTAEFLAVLKPDVMIISQILKNNEAFQIPVASVGAAVSHGATNKVAQYFQMWSAYTKKIFHIEPHPTVSINPAVTIAKEVSEGKPLTKRFIPCETVQQQIDPGWMRVKAAMKSCPKCFPIETRDIFTIDDEWAYYDKKTNVSLLCDNNHLSPAGVTKLVPRIKEIVTNAIKNL